MLTEEDRAELLASNASRDVVEKTIALVDKLAHIVVQAMAPRATGYEYEEACPFCGGDARVDNEDRMSTYEHADGCQFVALGLKLYEWVAPPPEPPMMPDQAPRTRREHQRSEITAALTAQAREMVRLHLEAEAPLMGDMIRRRR